MLPKFSMIENTNKGQSNKHNCEWCVHKMFYDTPHQELETFATRLLWNFMMTESLINSWYLASIIKHEICIGIGGRKSLNFRTFFLLRYAHCLVSSIGPINTNLFSLDVPTNFTLGSSNLFNNVCFLIVLQKNLSCSISYSHTLKIMNYLSGKVWWKKCTSLLIGCIGCIIIW